MIKKLKSKLNAPKIVFTIISMALFIALTKVKLTPIFGTSTQFTASVLFGPVLSNFLGIGYGSGAIIFSQLFGVLFGLYKIKSIASWLTFAPIIAAGIYFAKMFKLSKKLLLAPLSCIALFLFHPIGREVWYYSLFWITPILIAIFKPNIDNLIKNQAWRVYAYSLGSALTDHSVGSIIYLYLLNIPAEFWIQAIPFTLIERMIIAAGITLSYFATKVVMSLLHQVKIAIALAKAKNEKAKIQKEKTEREIYA